MALLSMQIDEQTSLCRRENERTLKGMVQEDRLKCLAVPAADGLCSRRPAGDLLGAPRTLAF